MAKKIKKLASPDFSQPLTAQSISTLIKARRTQSDLRLEDAASLCGVAKQTFMNIEHGKATAHLESVLQIFAGLGIKIYSKSWDEMRDENE